jgi:hypothetical protein
MFLADGNDIGQANPGITLFNIAAIRAMAPLPVKFFRQRPFRRSRDGRTTKSQY